MERNLFIYEFLACVLNGFELIIYLSPVILMAYALYLAQ